MHQKIDFKQALIPSIIESQVLSALQYYPSLVNVNIRFKFKKNIKKSTMQAQPTWKSFFRSRKNRSYLILISEKFKISDKEFSTIDVPKDVFIGWIGHELGHIMDYQNRTKLNLVWFGIKYLFSPTHIVAAERAADTFAVLQGMEGYILKTKNFILNHADISPKYKKRIKRFYLSPEEIMNLVNNRDNIIP
ncbi:hypothetical protein CW751_05135 [Brumimicrobium salinarum]|uniref:Uncharacterized protein n=1 Tax=Brumimicrobium salinarum TaxID=2058658 RepID=A0A2I0R4D1_9FLAO|nr:hypothetical protein [Brumimicrobium salinarum]PKR81441.1 hypothetical protein CW751_05135 [Brumimicrobium salinarum]